MGLKLSHGLRGLAACLGVAVATAALLAAPAGAGAAAPLSWDAPQSIGAAGGIASISCIGSSSCAAVDGAGGVIVGDPHSGSSWSPRESGSFDSVSCASASLCVAVGSGASDLATGSVAGGWSSSGPVDAAQITSVSCPDASFCVAVDRAGDVLSSTEPASSWSTPESIAGAPLIAVSCASASLCVAADEDGRLLVSSTPASAAAGSWREAFDSASPISGVSCAAGLCAAVDRAGAALASGTPDSLDSSWVVTPAGTGALTGVSCVSSGLCVAVDAGGAQASDDPAGAAPGWSASPIPGSPSAISCVSEGFCAVGESNGEVVAGQLPAPMVSTGGPSQVEGSSATVSGAVNPEDVPLSACRFEYGTSTGYGQGTPCADTPGPGSAPVEVSASLSGLAPATTYHYRLAASSTSGQTVSGTDGTFTTTAPPNVPLVHPAPYITGVPADGDRLSCNAGIHGATTATLAYAWWRDASPIPGATKQIYQITGADVGQHLQCEVIATDEAGSASARSAFVAVPAEGLPISVGETTIGAARIVGNTLKLPVTCSPQADPACNLELRLTAVEMLRGNKLLAVTARAPAKRSRAEHSQPVTLLVRKASVPRGRQRTISMRLNATGKRLLSTTKRFSAQLTVEGTVIGVLSATLAKEQVSVVSASARSGRRARGGRAHGARRRG